MQLNNSDPADDEDAPEEEDGSQKGEDDDEDKKEKNDSVEVPTEDGKHDEVAEDIAAATRR